jgi:acyl dehydratase
VKLNVNPALLRYQGPMLKSLGRVALASIKGPDKNAAVRAPGPTLSAEVEPRAAELVDAYVAWSGASAEKYARTLPPHLFPQWGFPLLTQTLDGLPYRMSAVLNQGCRLEVKGDLPRTEKLILTGRLEAVDDDGAKARIHQRLVTGTRANPELVVADVFAVIVKQREKGGAARPADTNTYTNAGSWSADRLDGLRFGLLTGDMNPLHWIPPYAKLAGFKNEILHGFGTFARTWELLAKRAGKHALPLIDIRFIRPLVLPATVSVETAEKDGERIVRVTDGKTIFAAGTYRL